MVLARKSHMAPTTNPMRRLDCVAADETRDVYTKRHVYGTLLYALRRNWNISEAARDLPPRFHLRKAHLAHVKFRRMNSKCKARRIKLLTDLCIAYWFAYLCCVWQNLQTAEGRMRDTGTEAVVEHAMGMRVDIGDFGQEAACAAAEEIRLCCEWEC